LLVDFGLNSQQPDPQFDPIPPRLA
jgi:hypothetical protein